MKLLTALVTLIALVGFGASAFACDGMKRSAQTTQSDDAPVWPLAKQG
jgi:hypothetical protein